MTSEGSIILALIAAALLCAGYVACSRHQLREAEAKCSGVVIIDHLHRPVCVAGPVPR